MVLKTGEKNMGSTTINNQSYIPNEASTVVIEGYIFRLVEFSFLA